MSGAIRPDLEMVSFFACKHRFENAGPKGLTCRQSGAVIEPIKILELKN